MLPEYFLALEHFHLCVQPEHTVNWAFVSNVVIIEYYHLTPDRVMSK